MSRLEELPVDARAAVTELFGPAGLQRLEYWRHLFVSGRLEDDSVPYYILQSGVEPCADGELKIVDKGPMTICEEDYYW